MGSAWFSRAKWTPDFCTGHRVQGSFFGHIVYIYLFKARLQCKGKSLVNGFYSTITYLSNREAKVYRMVLFDSE